MLCALRRNDDLSLAQPLKDFEPLSGTNADGHVEPALPSILLDDHEVASLERADGLWRQPQRVDGALQLDGQADPLAHLEAIRARLNLVRSPFRTAEKFGIEDIIDPRETRPLLCEFADLAWRALGSD